MNDQVEFVEAVRPMVVVLRRVADAGQELAAGSKPPGADSTAMMEVANEHNLQGVEGLGEPIHMAHSLGGVLAFASADHLRDYARLFESDPIAVYSHLVVARACLDACSVSAWVSEDGIGVARRAQRAWVLRIATAKQLNRSPLPKVKQHAKKVRDKCIAGANAAGWRCETNWDSNASPEVDDERLPWPKDAISAVLGDGPAEGPTRLASVLWWYLSGVTHGSISALMQSVQEVQDATAVTPLMAGLGTSAQSVLLMGCALGLAYCRAAATRAALFKWTSPEWDDAVGQLKQLFAQVRSAINEAKADESTDDDE